MNSVDDGREARVAFASHVDASRLRTIRQLPEPRSLPLLGAALSINPSRFHQNLERWFVSIGEPYRVRMPGRQFAVFGDAAIIRSVLQQRPHLFRRAKVLSDIMGELGVEGVFAFEGEQWKRNRKLMMPPFVPTQLKRFFPKLQMIAERLRQRWLRLADEQAVVDIQLEFERFATDVTVLLAFGHDVNTIDGHADTLQRDLRVLFPALNRRVTAAFPYWRYIKLPIDRVAERARDNLIAALMPIIAAARERLRSDSARRQAPESLLEAMIAAEMSDAEDLRLTEAELFGNVITLLAAGEDTTAHTLSWMVHSLVMYEGAQEKLIHEVDNVLAPALGLRSCEDTEQLKYLEGIAQECLRLKSVAPFLLLQPLEDVVIGDVLVPSSTTIVVLTRHAAMQADAFSEPARFMPERWMRDSDSAATRCPVHQPKVSMAFGAGPRLCPGRNLALLEMHSAMSMLARNFRVTAACDPEAVQEKSSFTMMPEGLLVRLARRKTS